MGWMVRIWTPVEARFSTPIQTSSGPHPASFTTGSGVSFPVVQQPGYGIDHPPPPPPNIEVKHGQSYTSNCLYLWWHLTVWPSTLPCFIKWYNGNMEEVCAVLTNLEKCNKDCYYNQGDSFLQTQSHYLYWVHVCFKKFSNSGRCHHKHTTILTWPGELILVHNPIQRWIFVKFTLNFMDFHKSSSSYSPICNIKYRAHQAIRL